MKLILGCLLAAMMIGAASAQDWAKAKLEKSSRHQEWVKIKHGAREVDCFVVYPEVSQKATAIVLIHEIFGLTDWARSMADDLAAAGYIVIAPDLISGMGKDGGGTASFAGTDGANRAASSLPPDQVTADLQAVAEYATKLPSCNGKFVTAGFCWGGGQTFRFASNNKDLKAAFVFYGPSPTQPEVIARIQCPVYGFYAGNDNRIGATLTKTEELMKQAGKAYEPVNYEGAGHGFMRAGEQPSPTEGNRKARADALKRLLGLLQKI